MKDKGNLTSSLILPEIKFKCLYEVEMFRRKKLIKVYCDLPEYFPLLGDITFTVDVNETEIIFPEVYGVHEDHSEAHVPAVNSFNYSLKLEPDTYESWSEEKIHEYIIERTKLYILKFQNVSCGYGTGILRFIKKPGR
ncbi:MAG: hypothetical protein ACFFAO_20220 [Candidatus Hermodarchaeota archaeon]